MFEIACEVANTSGKTLTIETSIPEEEKPDVQILKSGQKISIFASQTGSTVKITVVFVEDADRIEKLEAALREIIDERGICGHCGQLATGEGKRNFVICDKNVLGFEGPCYWTPQDSKDIARKALEGKDD